MAAIATLACTVDASPLSAQEKPPPLYRLGEVVVSAAGPVSESAATLRIVSAEEIEASGARTLDEALELLPGIDIRTGGQGVPRIDYRGFRSRHLLLLVDGIPVNAAWDGQADPSLIPAENIATIKVVPGTGSILYGEAGLAGVINVITKRGTADPSGRAGAEMREANGVLLRASGGAGSDRIAFFTGASFEDTRGFLSTPVSPTLASASERALRANSDQRRANLFANVAGSLSRQVEFGLAAMYVNAEYGIPPGVIDDPTDPYANRVTYDRVEANEGTATQLAVAWQPDESFGLRSWGYVNRVTRNPRRYDDATYSSMDDPLVRGTYDEHNRTLTTGAAAQLILAPRNLGRLTLALSAARDSWRMDLLVRDVATGGGSGGGGGGSGGGSGGGGGGSARYDTRTVQDDRSLRREGVAVEYELRPAPDIGLTVGWSRFRLTKDGTGTDAASAAVAGAFYEVGPHTRLRASVASRFHFPTVRQLYETDGGNPELRTEQAGVWEIGLEQELWADTEASLTLFQNDLDDYIERPGQGEPFENFEIYRFRGVELAIESSWADRVHVRASYTFLDARNRSPGSERVELQYRPRHRITLDARYTFAFGLLARGAVRNVSDQVYTARRDPTDRAELPAYTVADIRLSQRLPGDRFEASIGVDNVFDTAYEEQYGNPRPTRTLYAGLGVRW